MFNVLESSCFSDSTFVKGLEKPSNSNQIKSY